MEDMRRKKSKGALSSITKIAGYKVDESTVEEMLTFMGVNPNEGSIIQDAIGYLSLNGMEINMNNLGEFLKGRSIISRKDLRK